MRSAQVASMDVLCVYVLLRGQYGEVCGCQQCVRDLIKGDLFVLSWGRV